MRRPDVFGLLAALAALAAVVGPPSLAQAGGIYFWELGTPDNGRAAAGVAARAEDASTVFWNPAGMSLLERPTLQIGVQGLYGDFGFAPNASTTIDGGNGGNPLGALPSASVFYTHGITDELAVGVGVLSYVAVRLQYDEGWVGRYSVEQIAIFGLTLMPAMSYAITDWVSIGVGFNALFGLFRQSAAINNDNPRLEDGELAVDSNDWGFGANAGLLFSIGSTAKIGVTYLSPVRLEFASVPELNGLSPALQMILESRGLVGQSLTIGMTLPQTVTLSGAVELAEDWTLFANAGWQNWASFGRVNLELSAAEDALTVDRNYQDTWHGALGARFRFLPDWAASTGVAFDSSVVADEDRTLDFPISWFFRYSAGFEWRVTPALDLGLSYTFAWSGSAPVAQDSGGGRVEGTFERSDIHFFAANAIWRIGG